MKNVKIVALILIALVFAAGIVSAHVFPRLNFDSNSNSAGYLNGGELDANSGNMNDSNANISCRPELVISDPRFVNYTIEESDAGILGWNGKSIESSLYEKFGMISDDTNVVISAKVVRYNEQFLYNEKTLSEYLTAAIYEAERYDKLCQLLLDGDYLKYGEALYLTGDRNGQKWSKDLYEQRVAYYGNDLLDKYISNGAFLREMVKDDLASLEQNSTSAQAMVMFREACAAFANQAYEELEILLDENGIYNERKTYENSEYLVLYTSKEVFASLSLENVGVGNIDSSFFQFGLMIENSAPNNIPHDLGN